MTGVAGWHVPPPQPVQKTLKIDIYEGKSYISRCKRENRDRAGVAVPPCHPKPLKSRFSANTCPHCHHITIAGITEHGFTLHLEPIQLTDLDEARAIGDQVNTYNLYPDRLVRLRWLTHIRHPTTVPRHARHVCGTTYGTRTPPAPAKPAPLPDSPPF